MTIRPAQEGDRDGIWAVMEPVIREGTTYTLDRDMGKAAALDYWLGGDHEAFVFAGAGEVLGTYFIRPNRPGGGAHVANTGYMVSPLAFGRGVGRALCLHSLERARERHFRAMQFNFVVSTNERAVKLWRSLGFDIAGVLPGAFRHPDRGEVDAYVMYQRLDPPA
jgi:ribosomal protein S18 acetylase RimI-like enzyme